MLQSSQAAELSTDVPGGTEPEGGHSDRLLCHVMSWVCQFGSVRSFSAWFLGGSLISHQSTAMDAAGPGTDFPVSRLPITVVVCRPCISHKRAVLRRNILIPSSV